MLGSLAGLRRYRPMNGKSTSRHRPKVQIVLEGESKYLCSGEALFRKSTISSIGGNQQNDVWPFFQAPDDGN